MNKETALDSLKMVFFGCENLGEFLEAIELPYHLLPSIEGIIFSFFQQAASVIAYATKKILFFSRVIFQSSAFFKSVLFRKAGTQQILARVGQIEMRKYPDLIELF